MYALNQVTKTKIFEVCQMGPRTKFIPFLPKDDSTTQEPLYTETDQQIKSATKSKKEFLADLKEQEIQFSQSPVKILPNASNINVEFQIIEELLKDKQYYIAQKKKNELISRISDFKNSEELLARYEQFFSDMDKEFEMIEDIRKWFKLDTGWIIESSSSKRSVRYQRLPNSNFVIVRIESEVDLPLNVLISLIYETELYPQWFPFFEKAIDILRPDICTKILYGKIALPILSDRELYMKGWGVNNMEHDGRIYVLCKTIDQDEFTIKKYCLNIPPETKKIIRAEMPVFSYEIEPLTLDRQKIIVVSSINLKLKNIPDFLPNMMVRKFANTIKGLLFDKLLSKGKNYKGSLWEKKQAESPEFYQWMNSKVEEHFAKIKS